MQISHNCPSFSNHKLNSHSRYPNGPDTLRESDPWGTDDERVPRWGSLVSVAKEYREFLTSRSHSAQNTFSLSARKTISSPKSARNILLKFAFRAMHAPAWSFESGLWWTLPCLRLWTEDLNYAFTLLQHSTMAWQKRKFARLAGMLWSIVVFQLGERRLRLRVRLSLRARTSPKYKLKRISLTGE